ncbi:hypothetical protein KR018_002841, partial [Drosophila ironensis]
AKSNGFFVSRLKQPNIAPTLPLLSPHSPMNANVYLSSQHTQLSGRYLNNKVSSQLIDASSVKRVTSNRSLKDGQKVLSISSTLICNCEREPKPNGSDSETNEEIIIKLNSDTGTKLANSAKFQDSKLCKTSEGKNSTANESDKGCVQLNCSVGKDKRALSPRLSLHKSGFQQAIIISDESEVTKSPRGATKNIRQLSSNADNQFHRQLVTHKISKSEQTSPNNLEMDKANFLFDTNNRSTGCLANPSDPWVKNSDIRSDISPRREKHLNTNHNIDPWVRRQVADVPVEVIPFPKKNIYREKSLSSINNKLISSRTDKAKGTKPQLKHSKTALDEDHVFLNEPGLLFAPFSPPHNKNKTWSLDPSNSDLKSNIQSKSASFIPDKVKETSSPLPNHVRKSVYQNNSNLLCPNDQARSLLQVEKLHSRHSSLSIPNQTNDDELPLNIRRLSEQIREPPLERSLQLSLSDRNVSKMPTSDGLGGRESQQTQTQPQPKPVKSGPQLSDKFNLGNKNIAIQHEDFISLKRAPKDSTTVNIVKPFTSTHKPDPLLETTC